MTLGSIGGCHPSKRDRLREFYRRAKRAPAAASDDAALELLGVVMRAVEDELSGEPELPDAANSNLRLYPPSARFEIPPPSAEVRAFRQRQHLTLIGARGDIRIYELPKRRLVFAKRGANSTANPRTARRSSSRLTQEVSFDPIG